MAANSQSRGLVIFGKRFVRQIRSRDSVTVRSTVPPVRREVHTSVYEKNVEEHVQATVVPDDVIPPQSDKYWSPHPHTGVFGPEADHKASLPSSSIAASTDSVLEQKAFFRPLEDLDKPVHSEV